jgi:AcrR family transcriptional regulator
MNVFTERVHFMTPPRQDQKEATRGRILEVAKLHFERDGFEAASVRAIALEASVAAGTVLLHFTDKLSLLHATLHDDLEAAIARSLSAASHGPLLERLCAVARPFYAYYGERPRLSKVLLRESLLAAPPWQERFGAQAARVLVRVAQLVEEAKQSGEVPETTDAQLLSVAFASFYYFALIGWVQGALQDPMPLLEKLLRQHLGAQASVSSRG